MPIRDGAPAYGVADAERFPADEVLRDLRRADGADAAARIARILARYAALRHWLLREQGAPGAVTRHARSAARVHLGHLGHLSAPSRWREGELLRRLLDADPAEAGSLLTAAAREARAAGDLAGSLALANAARDVVLRRLRGRGPEDLN